MVWLKRDYRFGHTFNHMDRSFWGSDFWPEMIPRSINGNSYSVDFYGDAESYFLVAELLRIKKEDLELKLKNAVLSKNFTRKEKGLIFAATPASDFVCGTQQLASGIALQVFTTGRGTPYSLAMAPVIKVSSRTTLSQRWFDLIDLDAGTNVTGDATIEEVGEALFNKILDVASGGAKTAADTLGLANDMVVFNPAPIT